MTESYTCYQILCIRKFTNLIITPSLFKIWYKEACALLLPPLKHQLILHLKPVLEWTIFFTLRKGNDRLLLNKRTIQDSLLGLPREENAKVSLVQCVRLLKKATYFIYLFTFLWWAFSTPMSITTWNMFN